MTLVLGLGGAGRIFLVKTESLHVLLLLQVADDLVQVGQNVATLRCAGFVSVASRTGLLRFFRDGCVLERGL